MTKKKKYNKKKETKIDLSTFVGNVPLSPPPPASGTFSGWNPVARYMPFERYGIGVIDMFRDFLNHREEDIESEDFAEIIPWLSESILQQFFHNIEIGDSHSQFNDDLLGRVSEFLNHKYPAPTMNVITSFNNRDMQQKDYWLPAIKILVYNFAKEVFFSPAKSSVWDNDELHAEHNDGFSQHYEQRTPVQDNDNPNGYRTVMSIANCFCGIYASVNMSELSDYCVLPYRNMFYLSQDNSSDDEKKMLCIVEPHQDGEVYVARKGWKASHAFISEVIGETISPNDASELLSMVWNRKVDVNILMERLR